MSLWLSLVFGCADPPTGGVTDWSADLGPGTDWPTLVINEFMANNASSLADSTGAYPDWIELYNPTDGEIELDGWTMSDDIAQRDQHALRGLTIDARGWLLLFADDDEEQGDEHLGFSLSGDGEEIGLYSPDGRVVDELEYGEIPVDQSAARVLDGGNDWEITDDPTPGSSNAGTASAPGVDTGTEVE